MVSQIGTSTKTVTAWLAVPKEITESDQSLLRATGIIRWLAWVWAAGGLVLSSDHLKYPVAAAALMLLALVVTAAMSLLAETPAVLLTPIMVIGEIWVAVILLIGDGIVYEFGRPQSLPWVWPAAALITTGIGFGVRAAVGAAALCGLASFIGENALSDLSAARWGIAATSKAGLFILTAAFGGYVAGRLRKAETKVARAQAREEFAVHIHDGVLQTLAVIQRRSNDPELAALAREQERDLRDFLAGSASKPETVGFAVLKTAQLCERRFAIPIETNLAADLDEETNLSQTVIEVVIGAVSEALTNAAKHSGCDKIVVYLEPVWPSEEETAQLFISVKDNGSGFTLDTSKSGLAKLKSLGLRESIVNRIESIGGRVQIVSRAERGTEVKIWVP